MLLGLLFYALVAQLAEHIHGKDAVSGSIPLEGLLILESSVFQNKPWKFCKAKFHGYFNDMGFDPEN